MNILNIFFSKVVYASFIASLIALFILSLKKLFNDKINIRIHQILMALIIIRFCLIIAPESHLSLLNVFPDKNIKTTSLNEKPEPNIKTETSQFYEIEDTTIANDVEIPPINEEITTPKIENIKINFIDVISIIWFGGFVLIILTSSIMKMKINTAVRKFNKMHNKELLNIVNECKNALSIKNTVNVFIGSNLTSPYISGFYSANIYFPEDLMNINQECFRHIIMHELAHYKRKDLIFDCIVMYTVALHWFNPLIWKIRQISKHDIELACDMHVLHVLGEEKAISYGNTILEITRLVVGRKKTTGIPCYFANNQQQLERRIKLIKKFKNNKFKVTAVALMGAILLGAVILTNPISAQNEGAAKKVLNIAETKNEKIVLVNDSRWQYDSIESLVDNMDYEVLIPSYIPKDHRGCSYVSYDNGAYANITYTNSPIKKPGEGMFVINLYVSTVDPTEFLQKSVTEPIQKESFTLGTLNGEKMILKDIKTSKSGKYGYTSIEQFFVYKKDSVFYTINYKETVDDYVDRSLPLEEVEKIIGSLNKLSNVDTKRYEKEDTNDIYTVDQLRNVKVKRGFDTIVMPNDERLGDLNRIHAYNYVGESISFSYRTGVSFAQSKGPSTYYDQFKKNGQIEIQASEKGWFSKMEPSWIEVDGVKMMKMVETYELMKGQTVPNTQQNYSWENNGIYYHASFDSNYAYNIEEMLKVLLKSKNFEDLYPIQ